MKNLVICLVSMLFLLQSCDGWGIFDGGNTVTGKGNIERVSRAVVGFKAVHLQSSANVFIRQGTAFKVEVEAQKNIADIFETVVNDSVLVLKFKNGTHNIRFDKLNIYVEMPNIEGIEVAGSGDISVETPILSDNLSIEVAGSGNIQAKQGINANTLKLYIVGSGDIEVAALHMVELAAEVSGSGNLNVNGMADKASYSVLGSGDVEAKGLKAKAVFANITGSGNISCTADEAITANATGSGDIIYSGNATAVQAKATGSGSITKE